MWVLLATAASLFWGMTYVFSEQILKSVSVPTTIAIQAACISVIAAIVAFSSNTFKSDITTIASSNKLIGLFVCGIASAAIADFMISYSIVGKNATLAGLIEISYPLFIALFSYIIFRESELSIGTAIGGALIFLGVTTIYTFSK